MAVCGEWIWCAFEGGMCECPSNTVRFGVDPFWSEATIDGGEVKCLYAILGDPIEGKNKECGCRVEYDCDESLTADVERTTLFEFDASNYATVEGAFDDTGMAAANGMEFKMLEGNLFGTDDQLMFVGMSPSGGCNDVHIEIDSSAAMDTESLFDVTYEITATVGIDYKPELAPEYKDYIEKYQIFGGFATRPCTYACNWLQTETQYVFKAFADDKLHEISHSFRANGAVTVISLFMDMGYEAYVKSWKVEQVAKPLVSKESKMTLVEADTPNIVECADVKPKCVPFSSANFPFCEGINLIGLP
jgi:hypothetical protein